MKKVKIDKEKCINCGLCASIAEGTFKVNDNGEIEILEVKLEDEAKIQEAIDSCPVGAIAWEAENE